MNINIYIHGYIYTHTHEEHYTNSVLCTRMPALGMDPPHCSERYGGPQKNDCGDKNCFEVTKDYG